MFHQGEEEVTPVAGLGALYEAPDGTVYQVQGLEEGEELRGLSEEEINGALGLGRYVGEVRQGPDGQLYEWVQTVDGLGNPIGFWKKIRRVARAVARPVVRAAAPVVRAAAKVAKGALRLIRRPYCIALQPFHAPIRLIARRLCPIVQQPVVRTIAPIVPQVGAAIQATDRLCNIVRECGIAGMESSLMQAPDGTLYQVQGLAEDEESRGLAEDEELRSLGTLYQAPDGMVYQGISEDEELRGLAQEEELRGFAEDEELRGLAQEDELRGFAEEEELRGFAEDEELRGLAEDEDLRGIDQGYVRQDGVSGFDAYLPDQPVGTRWFTPPAQPPEMWKPLW